MTPRKIAIAAGARSYDSGRPCRHCGNTVRLVRKCDCPTCRKRKQRPGKNRRKLAKIKHDPAARAKHNARNRRVNKTPEGRRRYREWRAKKRATDPQYRLRDKLRSFARERLKVKGLKPPRTEELIGCSYAELKLHIEKQWQPGMSWDNWTVEGWHIDHVRPLADFDLTDPEQMLAASHFTNLQPLWAADNLAKGATFS